MNVDQKVFTHREQLCHQVATDMLEVISAAIRTRPLANIVLTGGGTGIGVLTALAELPGSALSTIDWRRVHFWFGDERYLPAGHAERNAVQASDAVLDQLIEHYQLPAENIHAMPAVTGDVSVGQDLAAASLSYAEELAEHAQTDAGVDPRLPQFDLVLLGVGPDAHIASLFPGLPGPQITGETVVAVTESPKPPPRRVSLSVEAINSARRLWFLVAGADKAEAVTAVHTAQREDRLEPETLPASLVRGRESTVWWLDEAATTPAEN